MRRSSLLHPGGVSRGADVQGNGTYGLLTAAGRSCRHGDARLAYAIWVPSSSDKLHGLDEAARIDGATPLQLFRLVTCR